MDKTKKFKRTVEDFKCKHCGYDAHGDGYTNHCPRCLWSRHVDLNPGDRQNKCGGMMRPVKAFFEKDTWFVMHECEECREVKKIKLKEEDNLVVIEKLIAKEFHQ